ncbi:MAG: hypothetical protein KVP17_000154 [Porospora cf. gigantea B]|uniref:uncharacterized protein n=2 Tax=Porospora cf. gigantea B TaxID=2853592 RepID=UPI003571DB55|nr:MAG: hypothetical protein KVP17_000154 [Porospora cf. gigantea B]
MSMLPSVNFGPVVRVSLARLYSKAVHDHFEHPRNVGSFGADETGVGTSVVGKAACGDVIKLQVKVDDDIIKDVKFKAFGCGSAIASSSYASEMIKGQSVDEALKISNTMIAKDLSLPPVKLHCSMLAEDAIKKALADYQRKRA